jgi:hypothetical protein
MVSEKNPRERIIDTFVLLGRELVKRTPIYAFEICAEHDIHAFYRTPKGAVIHVQGYPGLSTPDEMQVSARLRDYNAMILARVNGASVGNEHSSNIPGAFLEFQAGKRVPYHASLLMDRLVEEVERHGR